MQKIFRNIIITILLCLSAQASFAADSLVVKVDSVPVMTKKDSASVIKMQKKVARQPRDWSNWVPDPKRALWLALVLPGAGQIYNRKFWKLPIVYGGILGCVYAMTWNQQMYLDYSQAYIDLVDDDPNTKSYEEFIHTPINSSNSSRYQSIFKSRKDTYRRWRDLSFFCLIGVYALSVIDAYVDAQLSKFDISDDISLRIAPAVVSSSDKKINHVSTSDDIINSNGIGLHGSLTF